VDTLEEFQFVEKIGDDLGNLMDLSTFDIIKWWRKTD